VMSDTEREFRIVRLEIELQHMISTLKILTEILERENYNSTATRINEIIGGVNDLLKEGK
jgi:hypothetical protein